MRHSRYLVSLRTFGLAFAVVLSPAFMQTSDLTCTPPTGDTTLSMLEFEVDGVNQIAAFTSGQRSYDVSTTSDTAIVRAQSTDPAATVDYQWWAGSTFLGSGPIGVGGGEVTLDVPVGQSALRIYVRPPGGAYAHYSVNVAGRDEFPCTEQGILDAIARGGGPHTFDCAGPTTIAMQAGVAIDNDVILDGEGQLTLDDQSVCFLQVQSPAATVELRSLNIAAGCTVWNYGTLRVTHSNLAGWTHSFGELAVSGSTLAYLDSGAVYCDRGCSCGAPDAAATVAGSTIGDIYACGSTLTITNTIVHGGCWSLVDLQVSGGRNIESPGDSCGFDQTTNLVNVTARDLGLMSLADYGGGTMTHALLPGSLAIDAVPVADCVGADGEPMTSDQRGVPRPQGGACDAGAFEYADCSGSPCDDGNDCTVDHCDAATYAWCAHSAVPDPTSCDFGGAPGFCVAGECLESSWGTAEPIEGITDSAFWPDLAVDLTGHVTAVWSQNGIWANRYTPGVGWGTPVRIDANDLGDASYLQVRADDQGNAVALWNESDGAAVHVWSNRYAPDTGWASAELIGSYDDDVTYSLKLAVGANGHAVAVWTQRPSFIWSNRYTPGVGWSSAEVIMTLASDPDVAVDPSGNAIAVALEYPCTQDCNVWSTRYTPGIGWGTRESIDLIRYAESPQVAVDLSGSAIGVWVARPHATGMVRTKRYTAGEGWGTVEVISSSGWPVESVPQIAINPDGEAIVVWSQYSGSPTRDARSIWSNRYAPGVGWGTAERFDTTASALPDVAIDSSGLAVVVWEQPFGFSVPVMSNSNTPGSGWGTAEPVKPGGGVEGSPQVVLDPNGTAIALWVQYEGATGNIWSNRTK